MSTSTPAVVVPKEFETPEGLRTLANFLRSQNGVRVKSGIEHEKRVDYFKGKFLTKSLSHIIENLYLYGGDSLFLIRQEDG